MNQMTLTAGQQAGYDAFANFLMEPLETVFVVEGYSGTGKTTLVKTMLERLPGIYQTMRLIDPTFQEPELVLTATTNKAAENFSQITGHEVKTIQSHLGLRVHYDYQTGKSKLVPRPGNEARQGELIFVDEASYMDQKLLGYTFKYTTQCKIVLIGDPAQLLTVGCDKSPVFSAGFPTAKLTEVVRQAGGSPITDLATLFRNTVNTGEWFRFVPDGDQVVWLPRDQFEQEIINEFTRPDWHHDDSKVLAWTNKCVITYNHAINNMVTGDKEFQAGDYAICNKYIATKSCAIKTDQTVCITAIGEPTAIHGVRGRHYTIDKRGRWFMPDSLAEKKAAMALAKAEDRLWDLQDMTENWIDLRAAYACTINKAQGSTYDRVFIDLDDVKRCTNANQLARMLYVGVSRARYRVVLTGDIA